MCEWEGGRGVWAGGGDLCSADKLTSSIHLPSTSYKIKLMVAFILQNDNKKKIYIFCLHQLLQWMIVFIVLLKGTGPGPVAPDRQSVASGFRWF